MNNVFVSRMPKTNVYAPISVSSNLSQLNGVNIISQRKALTFVTRFAVSCSAFASDFALSSAFHGFVSEATALGTRFFAFIARKYIMIARLWRPLFGSRGRNKIRIWLFPFHLSPIMDGYIGGIINSTIIIDEHSIESQK